MTKTLLLGLALLWIAIPVYAQLPIWKGTQSIGGSVGGSLSQVQRANYRSTDYNVSLQPDYGYFLWDNFCIGISLAASRTWYNSPSVARPNQYANSTNSAIGLGPFLRYYYPLDLKLYAVASAHYNWVYNYYRLESDHYIDGTYVGMSDSTTGDGTSAWGVATGFSYFITPEAALETTLGYDRTRDVALPSNLIPGVNNRLSLNIGFRFFLLPQ